MAAEPCHTPLAWFVHGTFTFINSHRLQHLRHVRICSLRRMRGDVLVLGGINA